MTGGRDGPGLYLAAAGTLLFSTSAVLVRSAEGFGPLEVASFRLLAAAAFIAIIARLAGNGLNPLRGSSPSPKGVGRAERTRAPGGAVLAAGVAAALHFAFYITSLYWTTIAHSLVIVNLSPLLAIPLASVFLGERFRLSRLPGVLFTIAGLVIMVGLEPTLSRQQLAGDAMALAAALAYAVYSVIGRGQRLGPSLWAYIFWVYLVAGVLLLPPALWQAAASAASGSGWAWTVKGAVAVLLLALLPTAGGHTLYNAALRRAETVKVNLIATQEVTGGVILGLLILGEVPSVAAVAGGLVTLTGIYLVLGRSPAGRRGVEAFRGGVREV